MKITLCGSLKFLDKMLNVKDQLEESGHEVKYAPEDLSKEIPGIISGPEFARLSKDAPDDSDIWARKGISIKAHFDKIRWSDAILVLNYEKNDIAGYIGGNTLMEIGFAFDLGKKIYFLNPIPKISYREELLGMQPIILNGDVSLLTEKR